MNRIRRMVTTGSVLTCALVAVWASGADAAALADSGWWDRNNGVPLSALDPPPDGGLRVANDPTGPSAVAAVRFQLDAGEQAGVLTLRVAGDPVPAGAGFLACPPVEGWTGAQGGPFLERPIQDCDKGKSKGVVAADRTSVTFDVSDLVVGSTLDVVIDPAAVGGNPITDTFTTDFRAVEDGDLTTTAQPTGGSEEPSPDGTSGPPIASTGSTGDFGSDSGTTSFDSPLSDGAASSPFDPGSAPPPVTTTDTSDDGRVADADDEPAPRGAAESAAATTGDRVANGGPRGAGLAIAAGIIALGAYLWAGDRRRAVLTSGPVLGGLGPFQRERTGDAPQVI